jgi:4-hydroxybutyrate dehydrogenase
MTNISILALKSRNTKKGLANDALYADAAVLIPELLEGLPDYVFATSSIDALIHAIESTLSPKGNAYTRMFGYRAIEMILKGYKQIREQGMESRKELLSDFMLASNYAGIAFGNAGCAAVHALSYPLGATYHVAHGESNYAIFTGVMKNYMELKTDGEIAKLNRFMAELLECPVRSVYEELEALLNVLIPKKALHEYGVTKEQLVEFTDSVMENQGRLMANNFVELDRDRVYKIYAELF